MRRGRVLITQKIPPEASDLLIGEDLEVVGGDNISPMTHNQLLEAVVGMSGLIVNVNDRVGRDVFDAAGNELLVVSTYSVGTDHIDVDAASDAGVVVCNTPGVLTGATAEHAMALILAVAKNIAKDAEVTKCLNEWRYWDPIGHSRDLAQSTLGVVGLGRIGGTVVNASANMFRRIVGFDPIADTPTPPHCERLVSLNDLLDVADVISVHCPLIKEGEHMTRHLFGPEQFKRMAKRSPDLINTARGPIVDTDALVEAVRLGYVRAVGLDVTDPEPISASHPLMQYDCVTVTPHTASGGMVTRPAMATMTAQNAIAALRGMQPPCPVNWECTHNHPRWV